MEDERVRDRLNRLAREFYVCMGYVASKGFRFDQSQHPTELMCYRMAEIAFEEFTGDRPDYYEDED